VYRIVRKDLQLKCLKKRSAQELTVANCASRLTRAKKLLRRFPAFTVDFIFFTDEKIFRVAPPVNLQNDRVCRRRQGNVTLLPTEVIAKIKRVQFF